MDDPPESADREVEEITNYVDKFDRIVFYAINFKNESGFLLLSTDRRLKPILAFSDSGSFDMNSDNPGLQLWKDMIAEHFANVQQNDSVHIPCRPEYLGYRRNSGSLCNLPGSEWLLL